MFQISHVVNPIKLNLTQGTMIQPIGELKLLNIPTPDGENQPTHPSVLYFPAGWNGYRYWMAYTPHTDGSIVVENPCIAVSNDGENWEVPEGVVNPLFGPPPEGFYADTALVFAEGVMYLYWGHFGVGSHNANYRTESTDGVNWSEPVKIEGLADITNNGLTYLGNGEWIAFSRDYYHNLYKYTSKDGLTWRRRNPIHTNVGGNFWHSQCYYDGSGFHFLISAYGAGHERAAVGTKLYYGFSKDGNNIAIDPVPFIMPEENTFTSSGLYTSQLVPAPDGKSFFAYISAKSVDRKWQLGLVKVKLTVRHSDVYVPVQSPIHRLLFDELEVRDTANHYYSHGSVRKIIPEFTTHRDKYLFVQSSLDKPVTIRFTALGNDLTNYSTLKYNDNTEIAKYTIPANASPLIIDKNAFPILGAVLPSPVQVAIVADGAPTSGQITITLTALD